MFVFGIKNIKETSKNKETQEPVEEEIVCNINNEKIYLAKGETYNIKGLLVSEDSKIVKVVNNSIVGESVGITNVLINGCPIEVQVSDLYTAPILNNNKPILLCNEYSRSENDYLDTVLDYLISKVGYNTRAGVVEAARFLTLRFTNKLNYFFENGRLGTNDSSKSIVDGEGRYYHKGLYLNPSKISEITSSMGGPKIWGCDLMEYTEEKLVPNSLDCSGFVSWAMYNAGYDVGDIGAGPEPGVYDLTDTGNKVKLKQLSISEIKPGDLIGFEGHIGIIIGIKDDVIYIAHMYWEGDLQVSEYEFDDIGKSSWSYVVLMDSYYGDDGDLTYYWE